MGAIDPAVIRELAAEVEHEAVIDSMESGYVDPKLVRLFRAVPEVLDALATAEHQRGQALAYLARIERGEDATDAERAAMGNTDARGLPRPASLLASHYVIAAAARHTIGGNDHV